MPVKEKKKSSKVEDFFVEISAFLFWVYVITKLFLFDIDNYLFQKFIPGNMWVLHYKLIFILVFIAVVWLVTKKNWIYFWIFYIIFSPVFLLFFRIPWIFFKSKNWIGAFALIGLVLSFFKKLKFNFISAALTLLAFLTITKATNALLLYAAIIFLGGNLAVILVRAVYFSFKPSVLFSVQSEALVKLWGFFKKSCTLEDELKSMEIEKYSEQQRLKWITNLQTAMIFNRVCYFVSSKLRDFQKSKINIVYYVLNFLILVIATVLIFSFANYGVFRLDQKSFFWVTEPKFISFFNYSINTLFTNSISDFYARSGFARFLSTAEIVCAFFLLVIMFFLVTTIQSSRHNEELDLVIGSINKQGRELDIFIESEYRISIVNAMEELQKAKAGFVGFIFYLSKNVGEEK
ncbi:MAG: putative integral rane protein [Fibrobacteres bacterium]|nr:putative integral rane protein [Fibrobacterota bacterium]